MEACWTKTLHWAAPFEQISDSDNAVGKGGGAAHQQVGAHEPCVSCGVRRLFE